MADPITMLAVGSSVGTGISTIMGAGAARQQGEDQASMYNYRAYIAASNAQIALQNRDYDISTGNTQAFNNDLRTRQKMGSATADAGASGFDIGSSPSIKAGIDSVHDLGRYDSLQIVNNAGRRAQQDTVQSWNFTNEAQMDQSSATNSRRAGNINAMTTLIGGASSIAGRWAGFQNRGMFGGGSGFFNPFGETSGIRGA